MLTFWLRRLAFTVLTLLIVSIAVFALSELAPGNIARNSLGITITADQEKSFNAQNGLDQPALARYLRWMIGSDWQAARLIGRPHPPATRHRPRGLVGSRRTALLPALARRAPSSAVRQPDGREQEVTLGPDARPDATGALAFGA
jgi:peptide/nickel transport system permease protein